MEVKIEIISDMICPWCFIGKRYLDQALETWLQRHPDTKFNISWRPLYLVQDAKVSAYDKRAFYKSKFGSSNPERTFARITEAAEPLGIFLRWEGRTGNPRSAHKLIAHAAQVQETSSVTVLAKPAPSSLPWLPSLPPIGTLSLLPPPLPLPLPPPPPPTSSTKASIAPAPPAASAASAGYPSVPPSPLTSIEGSPTSTAPTSLTGSPLPSPRFTAPPSSLSAPAPTPANTVMFPLQHRIADAIYRGHFMEGQDLSSPAWLLQVAAAHGMDVGLAAAWLSNDDASAAIDAEALRTITAARAASGSTAVPTYILQSRFRIGGCQEPTVFLRMFERFMAGDGAEDDDDDEEEGGRE